MTKQEIEELSRSASDCLPQDWRAYYGSEWNVRFPSGHMAHRDMLGFDDCACTEIMVWLLWENGIDIMGMKAKNGNCAAWAEQDGDALIEDVWLSDPMLSFCIAVLRALIASVGG